mmetsp:Transcript_32782/g.57232  ORF Transcript_32782/g.57232 Transcript_32782/m.57232 type:complete len:211 (-) Transcript_32782:246-878(-)
MHLIHVSIGLGTDGTESFAKGVGSSLPVGWSPVGMHEVQLGIDTARSVGSISLLNGQIDPISHVSIGLSSEGAPAEGQSGVSAFGIPSPRNEDVEGGGLEGTMVVPVDSAAADAAHTGRALPLLFEGATLALPHPIYGVELLPVIFLQPLHHEHVPVGISSNRKDLSRLIIRHGGGKRLLASYAFGASGDEIDCLFTIRRSPHKCLAGTA